MSTITNPETIDKITANFIIKTLVAISGESSYESLNEMIQTLYANATTLETTLVIGKQVHVGLITNETLYDILATKTPW